MRSYFNDVLLIPCALPWVLWGHALLGWRDWDRRPTGAEIVGHLAVWALIAEGLGPRLFAHAVADWGDVAAYAAGACLAAFWWRFSCPHRKLVAASGGWAHE